MGCATCFSFSFQIAKIDYETEIPLLYVCIRMENILDENHVNTITNVSRCIDVDPETSQRTVRPYLLSPHAQLRTHTHVGI